MKLPEKSTEGEGEDGEKNKWESSAASAMGRVTGICAPLQQQAGGVRLVLVAI